MEKYKAIVESIKKAKNIVITSHKSPDGDSIGSSLALYHFIEALGQKSIVCHPDEAALYLKWVPGAHDIVVFEKEKEKTIELFEVHPTLSTHFTQSTRNFHVPLLLSLLKRCQL